MPASDELRAILQEFVNQLKAEAVGAGHDAVKDWDELRTYAAQRAGHLAGILERQEPGFKQALIAERDAIALKVAGKVVDAADATDQRILGIIQGALIVVAKIIALGLA